MPIYESVVCVPWRWPIGPIFINLIKPGLASALAWRGCQLVAECKGVTDPAVFGACLASGVTGIITDAPAVLQKYVVARERGAPRLACA